MSDTTDRMQEAARSLQSVLPPGTGFILLAFDFNQPAGAGRLDYVANADRSDAIKVMQEFIAKTEREGFGKHLDTNG